MSTGCISPNDKPKDEGLRHSWAYGVEISNPSQKPFYLYIPHLIWRDGNFDINDCSHILVKKVKNDNNTTITTENTQYGRAFNLSSSEETIYLDVGGRKYIEDDIGDALTLTLSSILNYSNLNGSIRPRYFWIYSNYSIMEQEETQDQLNIKFRFYYTYHYYIGTNHRSGGKTIVFQDTITIGSGWKEIPCTESHEGISIVYD